MITYIKKRVVSEFMRYVSDFLVQDVLDAGLPPQIEFPLKSGTSFISLAFYNPIKHTRDIYGIFAQTLATDGRL